MPRYSRRLREANALDFDDIILHTVAPAADGPPDPGILPANKFRYVLIDEYQDTNHLQYLLASLLAGGTENICVVGDDDQSIYRFRGANIENILSFEKQYAGRQDDPAGAELPLHPEHSGRGQRRDPPQHGPQGQDPVDRERSGGEGHRARPASTRGTRPTMWWGRSLMNYRRGRNWKDNAVLYRMNAQSNALEYAFKRNGVPYKIIGGTKFFDRAEVKDMLAYLCVINNPADDLRLRRIVNVPARKIGAATMDKAQVIATEEGLPLMEVLRRAGDYPQLKASAGKLTSFTEMIDEMRRQADDMGLVEFYEYVCRRSGYVGMLQEKNDVESRGRLENVEELSSSIQAFLENDPENPTLSGFLDEVALYTDLDSQEAGRQLRDADDHAQRQGTGVSQRVRGRHGGRAVPGESRHGRAGGNGGGAAAVLCGHDPGQGEADPDQRPAADAVRPHHSLHALPVSEGDPGGEHGVAGEARAPSDVLLGRFRRWACLCAAAARCGA